MRSLQAKLTLLATVASAIAVGIFGSAVWSFNQARLTERFDRDLGDIVMMWTDTRTVPDVSAQSSYRFWSFYGDEFEQTAFAVVQVGSDLTTTSNWPPDVTLSDLPEPPKDSWDTARMDDDLASFDTSLPDLDSEWDDWPEEATYATTESVSGSWRIAAVRRDGRRAYVAVNLAAHSAQLRSILAELLGAGGIALLVCALGAGFVARRALRPMHTLTETAESISATDLSRRISTANFDREFERLGRVFNGMLDRLEQGFAQVSRFSADAAHELKTPLTIMQGEIELALRSEPEGSAAQQTLTSQLDQLVRLKTLVNKLLLLSQADQGRLTLQTEPVEFRQLVEGVVEDHRVLSPDRAVELPPGPASVVTADRSLILQVLHNLLRNALEHGDSDGGVAVELTADAEFAHLRVQNDGAGIPPGDEERIFERFHRGPDDTHTRGLGLGLNLSREIARAHGGDLRLASSTGARTVFELTLPLAVD